MNLKFFGLLHINQDENSTVTIRSDITFEEIVETYLKDADLLSKTLTEYGIEFTLITNKPEFVNKLIKRLNLHSQFQIQKINFSYKIPHGIKFYSAHYKFDVFKYFSSLSEDEYVGLIDLDMVALGSIPQCLENLAKNKIPICYDVSDQVIPAHSHEVIIKDLERFQSTPSEGRWNGGEFIAGTPSFFSKLCQKIDLNYEKYVEIFYELHHNSDEMLTSVALEQLRKEGTYIADAGTLGIIGRYWSCPVAHQQKSFDYYKDVFLLHLPADKELLSNLDKKNIFSKEKIISEFEKNLLLKLEKPSTEPIHLFNRLVALVPIKIKHFIKYKILSKYYDLAQK